MRIIPERDLYNHLLDVKMPGQYIGGEYNSFIKKHETTNLKVALSFPDLYEIGMSNQALKILYSRLNQLSEIQCERVFAPDRDFEALLRKLQLPLYTLESGIPLYELDVLGFSIGYELTATNLIAILDLGGIPVSVRNRSEGDPIIIAGGPAITNPAPLAEIIDAFFIGEAEGLLENLFSELYKMKISGASREDLIERIISEPSVYSIHDENKTVKRSVWSSFGKEYNSACFPLPNIKPVQDNGVVEIMRGCPNGCRFCHAGYYYRPFRMKSREQIIREVETLIYSYGYREITLSSLSSGDYPDILSLYRYLNERYAKDKVSFSLPSLRINSVNLNLLGEISSVRKSGLTFAIETPIPEWQRGINKPIDLDRTIKLLLHAKENGWRLAKFYFMIGLPVSCGAQEEISIVDLLNEIYKKTGMQINTNIGTFIPKPHTPFQWARQLRESESLEKISWIKRNLISRKINIGYHQPFLSTLEGMFSRGDKRFGKLIIEAYNRGARFDAWEDRIDKQIWRDVIGTAGWDVEDEFLSEKSIDKDLPWDCVDIGVKKSFLKKQLKKAIQGEIDDACALHCNHNCGVCIGEVKPSIVEDNNTGEEKSSNENSEYCSKLSENIISTLPKTPYRMLFSFSKSGKAVFFSHLNTMTIFERAILRAGIKSKFSEGFNPKPRLEFAQPIGIGYSSEDEVAAVEIDRQILPEMFVTALNEKLPEGFYVIKAAAISPEKWEKRNTH